MRSNNEHSSSVEEITSRDLQVLSEVDSNPELTQRELSKRMGVALGLTNVLLRNLVQKGYVRAARAGWRRWLYTLTPDGFSHKFRLTVAYINRVLHHYQNVRRILGEQLSPLALNEESRVAILGTSELAELVYLGLREIGIEEIEIFSSSSQHKAKFLGMPIRDVATLRPEEYDRILVSSINGHGVDREDLDQLEATSGKIVILFPDGSSQGGL